MEMTDALYIGTHDEHVIGKVGEETVIIYPQDIRVNLECNGYKLDLDFIQDFSCLRNGSFEMFQGHSLREIEVKSEDLS